MSRCVFSMEERKRNTCLLVTPCLYCIFLPLLFLLNHCVFMDLHMHSCGFSFFLPSAPGSSHTVTFGSLTLPPSCVLWKQQHTSFLSLHHSKSHMLFCRLCRRRITIIRTLYLEEEKRHLAHHRTPTPPHASRGTMQPWGLEGRRRMRGKQPPPHPCWDVQPLALRCCWLCSLCIRAKYDVFCRAATQTLFCIAAADLFACCDSISQMFFLTALRCGNAGTIIGVILQLVLNGQTIGDDSFKNISSWHPGI